MAMHQRCVHVSISGRVQGVGYRAWTQDAAAELGIRGWVRNRRDGTVEAVFSGPEASVTELLARCKSGPRAARVAQVSVRELDAGLDLPARFEFRATTD